MSLLSGMGLHRTHTNICHDLHHGVHGIGVAASLGIPGIAIAHDSRGSTTKGFLADIVPIGTDLESIYRIIDHSAVTIREKSIALQKHKEETMTQYKQLVASALKSPHVQYTSRPDIEPYRSYSLDELRPLMAAFEAVKVGLNDSADTRLNSLAPEIRGRLINIELKINELIKR